jgi:hypothetical protein
MIPKRLDDVTEGDLVALIENQVREGRTIEYKRELPSNSEPGKVKFLAGTSSFANTSGGDILFGIEEEKGLPTQIVGIQASDLDREILRLEQTMDSGLEPRIRRNFQVVSCGEGKRVVILRIDRSWSGPHRVSFQDSGRFWGRNSAGKYPLDVSELRAAFTLSSSVIDRIRGFRTDRIIAISNNETPVPIKPGPKAVMHCIPVESFARQPKYDVIPFHQDPMRLPGVGNRGYHRRLNLDGLVVHDGEGAYVGGIYTQLYRNGVIEAVVGPSWIIEKDGQNWIASAGYEKLFLDYLPICFRVYTEIDASVPIVVALTLTNTRGLAMWDTSPYTIWRYRIDRDALVLPETVVQDCSVDSGKILKPMFDLVWNACGYKESMNFGQEGNWAERPY